MITNILIIALGGALGAVLRFGLLSIFNTSSFAYGTLIANGLGSFLAGVFFILITKLDLSLSYKYLLIIGFCGSLTTLSTISLDSINLFIQNNYYLGFINLLTNIIISLVAVMLGIYLAKMF